MGQGVAPDVDQIGPKPAFFAHMHHVEQGPRTVTRSSSVFYFVSSRAGGGRDGVRTQIHFLNYWREKTGVDGLTQRLTLRTLEGETIHVQESAIERRGAHLIEIDEILRCLPRSHTEGSIEVEFLAEQNLVMSYPALVVRYVSHGWHTLAHSCQRFYSASSADDHVGEVQIAEEGNITIHEDPSIEPFLFVHNGPTPIARMPMDVDVFSEDGRVLSLRSDPIGWSAYQTRRLKLRDIVDYRDFLDGRRGTFSIRFALGGVFPRLIGGHERNGVWSIDHTNFSATHGPACKDVIYGEDEPDHRELVFNIPNNADEDWRCFVDIFPTYPADEGYKIEVRTLDLDGDAVVLQEIDLARSDDRCFPRIVVNNTDLRRGRNLSLTYRHNEALPRRFHTGIHYQIGEGLPGFITDGPMPASTPATRTHWFPVFEQPESRNFLLIANLSAGSEESRAVTYDCQLFNCFGDDPLNEILHLEAFQQLSIPLNELFPSAEKFLGDMPGWVYTVAREPQRSVMHYASVLGDNSIAVCHAF